MVVVRTLFFIHSKINSLYANFISLFFLCSHLFILIFFCWENKLIHFFLFAAFYLHSNFIHFSCSFYCLSNISIKKKCIFASSFEWFYFRTMSKEGDTNDFIRPLVLSLMTIINYNWNSDIFIKSIHMGLFLCFATKNQYAASDASHFGKMFTFSKKLYIHRIDRDRINIWICKNHKSIMFMPMAIFNLIYWYILNKNGNKNKLFTIFPCRWLCSSMQRVKILYFTANNRTLISGKIEPN